MLLENAFKTVVEYAGRRTMWITPCKRSAARGGKIPPVPRNYVVVQPTTGLKTWRFSLPRATPPACTGLSTFKTYGLALKNSHAKGSVTRLMATDVVLLLKSGENKVFTIIIE